MTTRDIVIVALLAVAAVLEVGFLPSPPERSSYSTWDVCEGARVFLAGTALDPDDSRVQSQAASELLDRVRDLEARVRELEQSLENRGQ